MGLAGFSREARERAHAALVGKVSCAPYDAHGDYRPFSDGVSHDYRCDDTTEALQGLINERDHLAALLDTPEIVDFARAVHLEAAHQRKRWPSEHDAGKTDADWFWLIGYLGGKALHNPGGEPEKQLHRIITVAAACANWHAAKLGLTNMRPGIEPPTEATTPAPETAGTLPPRGMT